MENRTEPFIWDKYQIVNHPLDLPYCKVYKMMELKVSSSRYLVEYDKDAAPGNLRAEMELWTAVKGIPFPKILEVREEGSVVSIVCEEARGVTLETSGARSLSEEKVLVMLPALRKVMEGMQKERIGLPAAEALARRLYCAPDGDMRLLPLPLIQAMTKGKSSVDALTAGSAEAAEAAYVKAFGALACYLLTQTFPSGSSLSLQTQMELAPATADFLNALVSGKVGGFGAALDGALTRMKAEREKNAAPVKEENAEPSAALQAVKKPGAGATMAGIAVRIGKGILFTLEVIVRFTIFLVYLVASYYWEQMQKLAKWIRRVYAWMRRLTWNDIRSFFTREGKRIRQNMSKMRISIAMMFPVPEADMVNFTRHLATLLQAGVSFTYSLKVLHEQNEGVRLKAAIATVYEEVVGKGRSLSWGMRQTKGVFSDLMINMVNAGEVSGKLGEVLHQVADFLERNMLLRKKIKSAATYPIVISIACFGLFSFFVYVILPRLIEIFQGFPGLQMPLPTVVLIDIVKFAHSPLTMVLVLVGGVIVFFPLMSFISSLIGKARMDLLKLNLPVFGRLYKKVLLTRFCSTLGTMIRCGVPLLNAFEVTGRASGNEFFNDLVGDVIEKARVGRTLSSIFEDNVFFPPLFISMVQVGEESGNLEGMLIKMAQIYDEEVTYLLQQFIALIEPTLMAVMGCVVGFVVIAIFMPIYTIIGGIHS